MRFCQSEPPAWRCDWHVFFFFCLIAGDVMAAVLRFEWPREEVRDPGRACVCVTMSAVFCIISKARHLLSLREHAAPIAAISRSWVAPTLPRSRVLEILEGIIRFHIVTDAAIWGSARLISSSLRSLIFIRDSERLSISSEETPGLLQPLCLFQFSKNEIQACVAGPRRVHLPGT